jgi:hypothetical protein
MHFRKYCAPETSSIQIKLDYYELLSYCPVNFGYLEIKMRRKELGLDILKHVG